MTAGSTVITPDTRRRFKSLTLQDGCRKKINCWKLFIPEKEYFENIRLRLDNSRRGTMLFGDK